MWYRSKWTYIIWLVAISILFNGILLYGSMRNSDKSTVGLKRIKKVVKPEKPYKY
jgi:hypothetical protein